MPDSHDNLKEAFAGESQANRKYTYFAAKAEEEGYLQVARLFRAAAAAEAIHAYNHLKALGGIGATAENLQAAIAGETYEVTNMYPPFIEQAGQEGNRKAAEQRAARPDADVQPRGPTRRSAGDYPRPAGAVSPQSPALARGRRHGVAGRPPSRGLAGDRRWPRAIRARRAAQGLR